MRAGARPGIIAALVALAMASTVGESAAQGYWGGPFGGLFGGYYTSRPRPPERVRRFQPPRERAPKPNRESVATRHAEQVAVAEAGSRVVKHMPSSALVAVVSLRRQSLTVWDRNGQVLHSAVSSGQSGHATPTGLFSVIQKERYHESNIYSGAPMPWMHRITWSGIALHAGVVPGYPASHGCIRLPYDVAPKLWSMSRVGMRVVVAPDDAAMHMVDSHILPQPQMMTVAQVDELARRLRGEVGAPTATASVVLTSSGSQVEALLNPIEVAQRLRKDAIAAVEISRRNAAGLLAASRDASAEANAAADELASARTELAAVEAEVAMAMSNTVAAPALPSDQGSPRPAAAQTLAQILASSAVAAEAPPVPAGRNPDDLKGRQQAARDRLRAAVVADDAKRPAAFAAARAARDAEAAAEAAPDEAREIARRQEPVTVFVSGKEGQVFVRQGFEQVMDAAIEIDDAIEPLGTHVFTAMAAGADNKLAWSAVSMPSVRGGTTGDPLAALARISMPRTVRDEIARRVWTGASLIISDEGISHETGKGTDFVVLTK